MGCMILPGGGTRERLIGTRGRVLERRSHGSKSVGAAQVGKSNQLAACPEVSIVRVGTCPVRIRQQWPLDDAFNRF